MFRDECHPDISLSDWQGFCDWYSTNATGATQFRAIEEVLDRGAIRLPMSCTPLARGAAIASQYLLRRTGYRPGVYRPRGWKKGKRRAGPGRLFADVDVLIKDVGGDDLIVLRCEPFWRIARDYGACCGPHNYAYFVLAHLFGSTPIVTRTHQEATYLAEFCTRAGPLPSELCWVHECPDDVNDAIDFALDRRIAETRAAHRSSVPYAQSS